MPLYSNYASRAKSNYETNTAVPYYLKDSDSKLHQPGTPGYVIAVSYYILKLYTEGLNRNFKAEANNLIAFIENQFTNAPAVSTPDDRFAIILEHLQDVLIRANAETPNRNPNGDFAHATAAIYQLFAEARLKHLSLKGDKKLSFFPNSYTHIYSGPQNFLETLSEICVQIAQHFLIPFRVLFGDLTSSFLLQPPQAFVTHQTPQARHERYFLLAKKAKTASSRVALANMLRVYAARFSEGKPTWRTYRELASKLANQLDRGEIAVHKALECIGEKIEAHGSVDDGEFQHLLVGIYRAFASEKRRHYAQPIANIEVKIGDAVKMSISSFYDFLNDELRPETYSSYLELISGSKATHLKLLDVINAYLKDPDSGFTSQPLQSLSASKTADVNAIVRVLVVTAQQVASNRREKFSNVLAVTYGLLEGDKARKKLADITVEYDGTAITLADYHKMLKDNASSCAPDDCSSDHEDAGSRKEGAFEETGSHTDGSVENGLGDDAITAGNIGATAHTQLLATDQPSQRKISKASAVTGSGSDPVTARSSSSSPSSLGTPAKSMGFLSSLFSPRRVIAEVKQPGRPKASIVADQHPIGIKIEAGH